MSLMQRLRSLAKWTPLVAVAGVLSLALLPSLAPEEDPDARDRAALHEVRRRLETGRYEEARVRLARFLLNRRESARTGEAHFLLARTRYLQSRRGDRKARAMLEAAWRFVQNAERHDYDAEKVAAFRRSVAAALLRYDFTAEDMKYFRELYDSTNAPEDGYRLAHALAVLAVNDRERARAQAAAGVPPQDRADWRAPFSKGTAVIDEIAAQLPPEQRTSAWLAQAEMFWRLGDHAEIVRILEGARAEVSTDRDRALLALQLGRALGRLGRSAEALTALGEARAGLVEKTPEHDRAILYTADVLTQDLDNRGVVECQDLIKRGVRVAPVAHLILSRFERTARMGDWAQSFLSGLVGVKEQGLFEEAGLDFEEFYAEFRDGWNSETDDRMLVRSAAILQEAERIFPERLEFAADRGALWRRSGALLSAARGEIVDRKPLVEKDTRAFVQFLERNWTGGDGATGVRAEGAALAERAAARYGLAADVFVEVANSPWVEESQIGGAIREAADCCLAGGLFPRAASLYRQAYELQPGNREENLYWHAVSLMRAGVLGGDAGQSGALEAFEDFFAASRPGSPRFSLALLVRGSLLTLLGRGDDALDEFDRVLSDPALGIGPETEVWAEALLARGRTLLDLAGAAGDAGWARAYRGDAGRALSQYLERYSNDPARVDGVIEANYLLSRSETEEQDWKGALVRLDALESLTDRVPADHPLLREAWFLRGDLLLNDGQYDEAQRAYDRAYRRTITSPERLRGLIGRARANLKLGRSEEALRDYENSVSIFNAVKDDLDASLAGFGAKFFDASLQELRKELP